MPSLADRQARTRRERPGLAGAFGVCEPHTAGMQTGASEQRYVPAAGRAGLTGLYDPVMALTMREGRWAAGAARRGGSTPAAGGHRRGRGRRDGLCRDRPGGGASGRQGGRCRRRWSGHGGWGGGKAGAERGRRPAVAVGLPPRSGGADAVAMSLLLHHLEPAAKKVALDEAVRVLRPAGWLHIADWGRPRGLLPRAGFAALRTLDGPEGTRDHAAGRLPALVRDAGFAGTCVSIRLATVSGTA